KAIVNKAEVSLAEKIVRYGIMEKFSPDKFQSGDQRDASTMAIKRIIMEGCKRFVKIGKKINVPTYKGDIIMFGPRMDITAELYDLIAYRLAAFVPKNPKFISLYFKCFVSAVLPEKLRLESWEKIVS
ncbi:MAG TPA: hypothetical protein VJ044_15640, partial [Candidatus Hodarchaeales archaeon]|nr:hypothetical protein [Candidatus Hodarchaeales archaeon]